MKIVILGGGISGLSAAWYLRQKYPTSSLVLLEKTDRLGGWIHTSFEGGFLFETGPRTFVFKEDAPLFSLIQEVGLGDEVLFSAKEAEKRYLWHKGKLKTPFSLLPSVLLSCLNEFWVPPLELEDESIDAFARRRFGAKVAGTFFDPMTLGIFGGSTESLSIHSCFPFLVQWEKEFGSVMKGALRQLRKKKKTILYTLRGGMSRLIDVLAQKSDAAIHCHQEVQKICADGVETTDGFYPADLIISALPGAAIGRITGLWPDFTSTNLQVATLLFPPNVLPKKGYGYLVPTLEKESILGAIWDSSIFPEQAGEYTKITVMMKDHVTLEEGQKTLQRHLDIDVDPIFSRFYPAHAAIPQFHVGYQKKLLEFQAQVKEMFPSLHLLGNYIHGASVDACIKMSRGLYQS